MARTTRISSNNGGIFGTGVFGLFGSTVTCKAEDDSTYCSVIKAFNLFIILFVVLSVLYVLYNAFQTFRGSKGRMRGGSGYGDGSMLSSLIGK